MSSSKWIISSGVVALALLFNTSVQPNFEISTSLFSWLKPLFVVNIIIFTLAASWRLHQSENDDQRYDDNRMDQIDHGNPLYKMVISDMIPETFGFDPTESTSLVGYKEQTTLQLEVAAMEQGVKSEVAENGLGESGGGMAGRTMPWLESPRETDSPLKKPLVIRRLARQTDTVSRLLDEQNNTMDDTWKMITEGKSTPLSRHLNKSDMWQDQSGQLKAKQFQVKKSETFKNRNNFPPLLARLPTWLKLKKELALSPDEVTRRTEAFIKNFNEEMRLQRLESLKRYKALLRRGP